MSALDNPFHRFAMDIDGPLQQARAEIIACYEMQHGVNADEPCVQDAIQRLVASAYGRLDGISEAHAAAYEQVSAEKSSATDPFVERMAVYEQEIATYNSNDDNGPEPGVAFCDEIRSGALPIGTAEGAVIALRRVIALDCLGDSEADCMIDAVIAYLERRA